MLGADLTSSYFQTKLTTTQLVILFNLEILTGGWGMEWKCRWMIFVGQSVYLHRLHFCICVNYFVLLVFPFFLSTLPLTSTDRSSMLQSHRCTRHVQYTHYLLEVNDTVIHWSNTLYSSTKLNKIKDAKPVEGFKDR